MSGMSLENKKSGPELARFGISALFFFARQALPVALTTSIVTPGPMVDVSDTFFM